MIHQSILANQEITVELALTLRDFNCDTMFTMIRSLQKLV